MLNTNYEIATMIIKWPVNEGCFLNNSKCTCIVWPIRGDMEGESKGSLCLPRILCGIILPQKTEIIYLLGFRSLRVMVSNFVRCNERSCQNWA